MRIIRVSMKEGRVMAAILAAALCVAGCGSADGGPADPGTVATPAATPPAGAVISGTEVALTTTTAGAAIHYTTDGSDPTTGSTLYSTPIPITAAVTIKACAVKDGMYDSAVLTAAYTILNVNTVATPAATPPAGEVTSGTEVTLTTTTAGAKIYYTTDDSEPDINSTVYNGPISITAAATIKAYAVKDGMNDSEVLTAAYTIAAEDNSEDMNGIWIPPDSPMYLQFKTSEENGNTVSTSYGLVFGTYSLMDTTLTITLDPMEVTGAESIIGTASVTDDILTIGGFSSGINLTFVTFQISFTADELNATYSPAGELRLNQGHPDIGNDGGRFTVWVSTADTWSGTSLDIDTFGTWVPDGEGSGSYTPLAANIIAATPGQPSQAGFEDFAPLKWHGADETRTGTYDVFIVTDEEPPNSFSGRYKKGVTFTNGKASVNLGTGTWDVSWIEATVSDLTP